MPGSAENRVPSLYAKAYTVDGNSAMQLVEPDGIVTFESAGENNYVKFNSEKRYRLLNRNEGQLPQEPFLKADYSTNPVFQINNSEWFNHPEQSSASGVIDSLVNQFTYKQETVTEKGLRLPQIGALHAVSANWTLSTKEPVTIVMPTGTGKTETMVSIFAAHRIPRLLVIVPSDALRTQIAQKFESYGVLQDFGVVGSSAKKPIVGKVEHGFKTKVGAKEFAKACNVVIATASALNESESVIRTVFLEQFTHLFVDEAHHIAAETWKEVRDNFIGKPVVQFTATPFREDGQRMGGKIIYSFPLKDAQELGVFSKINYISVVDFNDIDRAIAKTAVEKLREDLSNDYDHVLMARVQTKKRADELLPLYEELAPDLKPIVLYSGLKPRTCKQRLSQLLKLESKIVVCVDMLGEGFDLPALKIAAIHDPHRSLGVTLQFIGRFARVGGLRLGDATAVVGRGHRNVDVRLRELYSEDSDWNKVIRNISADAIEEQQEMSEFEQAFSDLPDDISIVNLSPKMSTVAYKAPATSWHPEKIENLYKDRLLDPPAINHAEHVAWFITKDVEAVRWGDVKSIAQTNYSLFVAYWDSTHHMLYINSSNNEGVFNELAEALCGESVELFKGASVYKTMASLNRRIATNVGLLDTRNRDSKFELRVGADVIEALDEEARRNKSQTNIFAHGLDSESGERLSVGASLRGRVWSHKAAMSIKHWMTWAESIGAKLNDSNIDPADVMDGFIVPESLQTRPADYVVLGLEWPTESWLDVSESTQIQIGDSVAPFNDIDLTVTDYNNSGPIPFTVFLPDGAEAQYRLIMNRGKMLFSAVGIGDTAFYVRPRSKVPFVDFLNEYGLRLLLNKEAVIEPEMVLIVPKENAPAYRKELLKTIDWSNTDLSVESQGRERNPRSIQARVIEDIKTLDDWDIIIDDDGAGEVADIVALKIEGNELVVNLVHCKYSTGRPGARVKDLYEVCGQAQKSIMRRLNQEAMIEKLIQRERNRQRKHGYSGIMVGDEAKLMGIADKSRLLKPKFTITIAQPGVSKSLVSNEQLELLASTEKYIKDSGGKTPLIVITSE